MKNMKMIIASFLVGCVLAASIPVGSGDAATTTVKKYYRDACSYTVKDTKGFKNISVNGKSQKNVKGKKLVSISCSKAGKYTIKTVNKKGTKKNYVVYIDETAPAISGVTDEKIYSKGVKITVKDNYKLKSVTLNGVKQKKTSISISADGIYDICAVDMAGNMKEKVFIIDIPDNTGASAPAVTTNAAINAN